MSGTHVSNSGGAASLSGTELAYAERSTQYAVANTGIGAPIPGLAITYTVPIGTKYVVEFYASALDEDSGSTAGHLVTATIGRDNTSELQTASVRQAVGGFGSSVFLRTPTLTGDGVPHTDQVLVANVSAATDGVLVEADGTFPMFIRAVAL